MTAADEPLSAAIPGSLTQAKLPGGALSSPRALHLSLAIGRERAAPRRGQARRPNTARSRPGERRRIDCRPACGLAAQGRPAAYSPQWKSPARPKARPPFYVLLLNSYCFASRDGRRCQRFICAAHVLPIAPHALFMVAAAARRQGTRRFRTKGRPREGFSP
jgi:hypothetical protein